jgi:hypothetical protein
MSKPKTEDMIQPGNSPKALAALCGHLYHHEHSQATAANGTADLIWHATFDGEIVDCFIQLSAVVGAGESMTYAILKNGSTILTSGPKSVDSTNGTAKAQLDVMAMIAQADRSFVKGDVLAVTRAYTAGGTPTPMARNTVVLELSAFGGK